MILSAADVLHVYSKQFVRIEEYCVPRLDDAVGARVAADTLADLWWFATCAFELEVPCYVWMMCSARSRARSQTARWSNGREAFPLDPIKPVPPRVALAVGEAYASLAFAAKATGIDDQDRSLIARRIRRTRADAFKIFDLYSNRQRLNEVERVLRPVAAVLGSWQAQPYAARGLYAGLMARERRMVEEWLSTPLDRKADDGSESEQDHDQGHARQTYGDHLRPDVGPVR